MQVEDVVKMMEVELGEGWILNKQSKVAKYKIVLNISSISLSRTSQTLNIF